MPMLATATTWRANRAGALVKSGGVSPVQTVGSGEPTGLLMWPDARWASGARTPERRWLRQPLTASTSIRRARPPPDRSAG